MKDQWKKPKGHPISIEKAKELSKGPHRSVCMEILKSCCSPIYWLAQVGSGCQIVNNGTITFLKISNKTIGITAAHVFRGYEKDSSKYSLRLFIGNGVVDDLSALNIDINDKLDLATFEIQEKLLNSFGKNLYPLSPCDRLEPLEGRGIMLAGYPGKDIKQVYPLSANFGLFTALGVARRITDVQITWKVEREFHIEDPSTINLPPNYDLGGISGGPLICWFETPSYISHFKLGGIISEASADLENVIAKRVTFIKESGKISTFK